MSIQVVTNFTKQYYSRGVPKEILEDFPVLDMLPKDSGAQGSAYVSSVLIGNPQGIGATYALAAANKSTTGDGVRGKQWSVGYGDLSGAVDIDDKAIQQSKGDAGAFIRWYKESLDGIYRAAYSELSTLLFADPGNSIGYGTITSGVITLASKSDIVKFEPGMALVASANDGSSSGHSLLGSGSQGYVFAVDQNAGTVTVATTKTGTTAATPASWTGNMYFFREGNFGGGATPNYIIKGFGHWIPSSSPTAGENFFGVDRSTDVQRLAGTRLTAAEVNGQGPVARLKQLATITSNRGYSSKLSHFIVNPEKWQDIADELENKGYLDMSKSEFSSGALTLKIKAAGQVIEVIADRHCPVGTAFVGNITKDGSNVVLGSLGELVHPVGQDGDKLEVLRNTGANSYEHRVVAYPAFCLKAPGAFGRCPM